MTNTPSNLVLTFPTAAGRNYRLRQHLGSNSATYYPIAPLTGNGSQQTFTIPRIPGSVLFTVEVSLP